MAAESVLEIISVEKRSCFGVDRLRDALSNGGFVDADEALLALDHLLRPCHDCWRVLEALAEKDSFDHDLSALEREARRRFREPPFALVLARRLVASKRPASASDLAPVHRYLLLHSDWHQAGELWWLLIEETRHLALSSPERQVGRWTALAEALAEQASSDPGLDEWKLLIEAYKADELRVVGRPHAAADLLSQALNRASFARPEIRATLYEVRADLERSWREPARALRSLANAEECLSGVAIPGRLAEIRTRVALSRLLQEEVETALRTFGEALEMIPPGTDPRLRLEILLHQAALEIRLGEFAQARSALEQAEPLFEPHASELMRVQRSWLWGLVHLDSGENAAAVARLNQALRGFGEFGAVLAQAQVLFHLMQIHLRTQDENQLNEAFTRLVATLRQPEVRLHLLDDVERLLLEARKNGLEVGSLAENQDQIEWIH